MDVTETSRNVSRETRRTQRRGAQHRLESRSARGGGARKRQVLPKRARALDRRSSTAHLPDD
jgi:hypothetical protein